MKQHLCAVLLLLLAPLGLWAQSGQTMKLDSMALRLFKNGNYEKSLEVRQKHLEALGAEVGDTDSTYIMALVQLAKCYYRVQDIDRTLATAQRAADLYAAHVSRDDRQYAFLLDNLALYQGSAKQSAEGLRNAERALALYQRFNTQDHDLAVMYAHVAELAHDNGDNAKAIRQELLGLNVLRNLYGEHSKAYTDEAAYLQRYYEANGDKAKADETAEQIEKLAKETEDGAVDLPKAVEFTSAAVAHDHNRDALRCIDYLLNHYVVADKMAEAAEYIMAWSQASSDSHVVIGENEAKLLASDKVGIYGVAYLAGCGRYALQTGEADFSLDTFKAAMVDMLNFYDANKQYTGEVKYLEQYIKAYKKGQDKLEAMLEKNFPGKLTTDMVRRINSGEEVKIEK